jgi:hypothetical protein
LQVFLAIDTEFMRAGWSAGNSTFFMSALALTYLVLDPLLKGIFTLRSYYWDARTTGEDLRVELNRLRRPKRASPSVGALLLLVVLVAGAVMTPSSAHAEEEAPSARPEATVSAEQLDHQIERVLSQREYIWRLPRPAVEEEEAGLLRRFVDTVAERVREIWRGAVRTAGRVLEWLIRIFFRPDDAPVHNRGARDWTQGLQMGIIGLGVALLGLVGLILWQAWKKRRRPRIREGEEALPLKPDLEDENVTADALPVDEWSRLAADYKAKGEFRLALRAFYLASLAALAEANLIVLARAKSNREYQEELWRRAHDQSGRVEAFRQNCRIYEQAWYGMYPVDGDTLAQFESNQQRIDPHEEIIAR